MLQKINTQMTQMTYFLAVLLFGQLIHAKIIHTETIANEKIIVHSMAAVPGPVWGIDFLSSQKMIFTLKSGKIGMFDVKTKSIHYLKNVPKIALFGQGGLMDIKLHNNWLYLTYSAPDTSVTMKKNKPLKQKVKAEKFTTFLARTKFSQKKLFDFKILFKASGGTDSSIHFGSRVTFDNHNHLFISVGDRGHRPNGQNPQTHAGSIIRLNLDGTIPHDNPYKTHKKWLPEVYSIGHRILKVSFLNINIIVYGLLSTAPEGEMSLI